MTQPDIVLMTSLPDTPRLARFIGEVVPATLVAAGTSLAIQLLVGLVRVPVSSLVPVALGAFGAAVLVSVLLLLSVGRVHEHRPRTATALTWVALSALATLPLSVLLLGTKHYIFGVSGDQSFRVQYLTRFVDSARLADFAYADLPPYYPAGWFWIGGRIADLAGLSGWEAYKPYAITTMAIAGVLAFCVWSLVVRRTTAGLLALVTTVLGVRLISYEPYLWLLGAVVPPLVVLALRIIRVTAAGGPAHRWMGSAALVGVVLGAAGAVYSLLFWYLGLLLVTLAAAVALLEPRRFHSARRIAAPAALIAVVALPLVLTVWTPYLAAVLDRGFRSGAAQRFLPESGALWPLPMVEPSATGVLTLAGTVWIVARFRSSDVAQALGAVVLTGYAWYALSTLALAAGTTLLAFKLEPLLVGSLACAGVFGLRDGVRATRRRLADGERARAASVTAVVVALSFAALVGMVQTVPQEYEWSRGAQYGDYYPTGVTPLGTVDQRDAGAWNDELSAAIDELTDVQPRELVVLSTHAPLVTYHPYLTFQATIDQYANPLADFPARRTLIERWAASSTSAELLAALDATPMRTPTVFVLSRQPNGFHLGVTDDAFPAQPNVGRRAVVFDPTLFEDPAFQRRDVGPFTVIVRGP